MLEQIKPRLNNWLASDHKAKKLAVSIHYYLFRHRLWGAVRALDSKSAFTEIYRNNLWNNEESRSGGGSTLKRTKKIREGIQDFLRKENVKSICDAGCGDFNWMKTVDLTDVTYIGVDIVKDMIAFNASKYGKSNVSFFEGDIIRDDLPVVDLVLCREVLFHLPFQEVCQAIANFKRSQSKYFLTTHFPYISKNVDVAIGQCRGINFQQPPLNFSAPVRTIEEDVSDHCLALWKLKDIDLSKFEK